MTAARHTGLSTIVTQGLTEKFPPCIYMYGHPVESNSPPRWTGIYITNITTLFIRKHPYGRNRAYPGRQLDHPGLSG